MTRSDSRAEAKSSRAAGRSPREEYMWRSALRTTRSASRADLAARACRARAWSGRARWEASLARRGRVKRLMGRRGGGGGGHGGGGGGGFRWRRRRWRWGEDEDDDVGLGMVGVEVGVDVVETRYYNDLMSAFL